MKFLDLTLTSVPMNLALDEALLLAAEDGSGGEVLRLWESPHPAVVLGSGGVIADDVDEEACWNDNVDLWRRSSGGGTVLLGSGCLLFSLVLAYQRAPQLSDIHGSYRYILGKIIASLTPRVPGITVEGISDLALAGQKFSGNAQQRKRDHLLHHGTLLYSFDLALLGRYLKPPPRQPDYRQQRDHRAFVTNLPLGSTDLRQCLLSEWDIDSEMSQWPEDRARKLYGEKYLLDRWIRRR